MKVLILAIDGLIIVPVRNKHESEDNMKNTAAQMSMCNGYTNAAATHNYVFTFEYARNVWALCFRDLNSDKLQTLTKLDRASRGAGLALRFKPTNADKVALVAMGAQVLCSVAYFNDVFASVKYNRGEVAEMLVTEQMFGQKWVKDSVPFTVDGDINADGVKWQHKHQGATFCNERTLHNLAC